MANNMIIVPDGSGTYYPSVNGPNPLLVPFNPNAAADQIIKKLEEVEYILNDHNHTIYELRQENVTLRARIIILESQMGEVMEKFKTVVRCNPAEEVAGPRRLEL